MIDIQTMDQEHKAFTFADFERRRQLMRRCGDEKALAELEEEIAKVEAHYASTTPKERVSGEWFQIIENSLGDFGNCVVNRETREVTELSGAEAVLHWIDTLKHHCERATRIRIGHGSCVQCPGRHRARAARGASGR